MRNIFKVGALSVAGLMSAVLLAGSVAATAQKSPAFNAYDGVRLHYGVGSESDFLRLGQSGELGNTIEACEDGQLVDLWFYVHNSTAESSNGANFDGPGVATNTVISLDVDEDAQARSHSVVASIDSDQTNPFSDGVTITCADKDIKLVYNAVTYFGTRAPALSQLGNFSLVGEITEGASLGYQGGETKGVVPGCWQYRARLNIQLQVVEVVEEEVVDEEPEVVSEEPEETPEEVTQVPDTGIGGSNLDPTLAMLVFLSSASLAAVSHKLAHRRR